MVSICNTTALYGKLSLFFINRYHTFRLWLFLHLLMVLGSASFTAIFLKQIMYMCPNLGKPFQIAHQVKSNQHHQHIATPL